MSGASLLPAASATEDADLPTALPLPRRRGAVAALLDQLQAILAAERGRLAPWLAVAMGVGVITYLTLRFEPDPAWRWAALPLLVTALALRARAPTASWLAGLLAAAAIGAAAASWQAGRAPPMPELPRGATILSGTVLRVELLPEEGRRVTLGTPSLDGGAPIARDIRVRLRAEDPARPEPGDRLTIRALVRAPAAPAYPGAWDFQRNAWFSGLAGSGFAIGRATLVPGDRPAPPLAGLRAEMERRVTTSLPGATGAIASALLTGGQSAIPPAEMAAMRDSGLAHLLSVSGLHIAIVMGLGFSAVRLLLAAVPALALRLPVKACAALASLMAGGFYLVLTGSQVPAQRSFAMAALTALALLLGRRALTLRAWALAAAAVMLVAPDSVLGPSFQMSFAAVLALISGWEAMRPRLFSLGAGESRTARWKRRALLAGFGMLATSVLAGAATTPFGLHHFGRLQLYGVAANAVAVPITSALVMPAGMVAAALMPFGLEGLALAPMGWGIDAVILVARGVAAWPGAALSLAPIPAWGLAVVAFGMLWLCLWRTRWRLLGLPLILAGLASGALDRPPDLLVSGDGRLIAARVGSAGEVHLQRLSGASALTRDSWLRLWGVEAAVPFPSQGEAAAGRIACTAAACRIAPLPEGAAAVLLRAERGAREACDSAAVVVSAEPVRERRCAAAVVDRFAVWRNGPHAIWLGEGGARVVSDRGFRGDRPWVPPLPTPRGGGSAPATSLTAEPTAPVE